MGVKGKTTSVFMLKEIFIDENPLILSSLGALLYKDNNEIILKKNISITPANIKETVDLAYKIANPICKIAPSSIFYVRSETQFWLENALLSAVRKRSGISPHSRKDRCLDEWTAGAQCLTGAELTQRWSPSRALEDNPFEPPRKESIQTDWSEAGSPGLHGARPPLQARRSVRYPG